MYKNYIFDLYGTLVDIKTDEENDMLWEKMTTFYSFFGAIYEPEDFKSKYLKYIEKMTEVAGGSDEVEINLEDIFFQLFKKKKIKTKKKVAREAARMFRVLSLEHLELYPFVEEVLQELKDKGKNIFLLTNAQECFTRDELTALDIDKYFDGIYISSDLGVRKPSTDAFNHVIKANNLNISKTIMIGNDHQLDIEGANRVGMDSVFIKTNIYNEYGEFVPSTYEILDGDLRNIITLTVKK